MTGNAQRRLRAQANAAAPRVQRVADHDDDDEDFEDDGFTFDDEEDEVGAQVEAHLPDSLEVIALDAEQRDARELAGHLLDQRRHQLRGRQQRHAR